MKKIYLFLVLLSIVVTRSFAQADCSSATIVCGNTVAFNPSGVGQVWEQLACGSTENNSQWVAFQAQASGNLNFTLRPYTIDGLPSAIDFDWSFYQLPGNPNTSNCNAKIALGCNYASVGSPFAVPGGTGMATFPGISNTLNIGVAVTAGTWYVLHIDQFSNATPQVVSVQFTGNPESPYLNSSPGIFAIEPNFTQVPSGCGGLFNFTNTSTAVAGIASYAWEFGDGTTSTLPNPSKTFIQSGTYYVTLRVTDNNGCTSVIKKPVIYNITNPTLTAGNIIATNTCTNSANGTLTINYGGAGATGINGVNGGTAPYTFELVNPSPIIRPSQVSNVFANLAPGTYTIKATDACGRSATTTVAVGQVATNSTMTFGQSLSQASCIGSATGSALLTIATATVPPYTLQLVAPSPVVTAAFNAVQTNPTVATSFGYNFTGLLPGVYNTRVVDGCGKVQFVAFTIAPSTVPLLNATAAPSCNNTPTGMITMVGTGGSPGVSGAGSPGAFQYSLISPSPMLRPYQNSSLFEGLLPGSYRVAAKDACGNESNGTITVNSSTAPVLGTHFTTTSCPNSATGTLEVTVSSSGTGGGPLTYELIAPSPQTRAAQTNNVFTALPPGTYTIRLTNSCGLVSTSAATITQAAAPSFTTTLVASCSALNNGSITVTPATTGVAPYSFSLIAPSVNTAPSQPSNIANTANSIFKNLAQGPYTVQMIDGCNSPVTSIVTIAAPTALVATTNTTIASCAASPTGQLTVPVPTTGSAPYTYELIAPSPTVAAAQISNVFNTLAAGAGYTVRITDACGTQITNTASTIATVAAPTMTITNTGSCSVTSTGTITARVNAQGGGGPYQFALIAPSPVTAPNQTNTLFTGLSNGTYTIQITDACGVTATTTTTLAITLPTPTATSIITGCAGAGYVGRVVVTPQSFTPGGPIQGGGGAYSYSIYDATNTTLVAGPQSTPTFDGLPAIATSPQYVVRFTDVCGTTATVNITTLVPPASLAAGTLSITQPSCTATANGIITTAASTGGLAPLTYTLIDPAGPTVIQVAQTDRTFTNVPALASGYQVRTTDACGNVVNSTTLIFAAAAAPTVTATTTPSCPAGATGTATATVGGTVGGGGNFSYTLLDATGVTVIAGPQATQIFTSLAPATYTLRITDLCGVSSVAVGNAVVSNAPAAQTSTAIVSRGTCSAGSDGVITASSTGGSGAKTFTLLTSPGLVLVAGPQASNIFTGVAAGAYVVATTDACGTITNSTPVTLAALSTIPTLTTSVAVNCGTNTLSGYGAGGSGAPYTYAICTGAACTSYGTYTAINQFVIPTGTYRISVADRCGLLANTADIVITTSPKPSITAVALNNTSCTPADITAATVAANGALGTVEYSINGGSYNAALPTAVAAGCNNIKVRYNNSGSRSCESDNLNFLVFPTPTVSLIQYSNCNVGANTTSLSAVVNAVASNFIWEYSLDNATWQTSSTFDNITLGSSQTVYVRANYTGSVCTNGSTGCVKNNAFTVPVDCPTLLSINGLSIRGNITGSTNTLYWNTLTEANNNKFVVQRSTDGVTYSNIGTVATQAIGGNSSTTLSYNFLDANPVQGKAYYKLQIVNNDNKFTYSPTVTLRRGAGSIEIVDVRPNPTTGTVYFNVIGFSSNISVKVLDMSGKTVAIKANINTTNNGSVDMGNLANGTYILQATDAKTGERAIFKIVKN